MPLPGSMGSPHEKPADPAKKKPNAIATPHAVRCANCKKVGLVYFEDGWNLAQSDALMEGRVIRGACGYCNKQNAELIPIPNLTESDKKELQALYNIQETLKEAARQNWDVTPQSLLIPKARLEERAKWGKPE
jgi:hypothetical protein